MTNPPLPTANDLALKIGPVTTADPSPLYRQIINGFKRAIAEKRLAADQPLPSFRSLAKQLLVSVITVRRAYDELEREGIICRRQGLGTFVAAGGESRSRESKREEACQLLVAAVAEARESGLSDPEVATFIQHLLDKTLSGNRS